MFQYLEKFKKLPKELQQIISSPSAAKIIDELEKKYGIELAALMIKIMVKEISFMELENYLTREHHLTQEQAALLAQEIEEKVFNQVTRYLGIKSKVESEKSKVKSTTTDKLQVPPPYLRLGGQASNPPQALQSGRVNKEQTTTNETMGTGRQGNALPLRETADDIKPGDKEPEKIDKDIIRAAEAIGVNQNQTEDLRKLGNILKTFKQGIRDDLDTVDTLKKPKESGGLALSQEQAEKVINTIGGKKINPPLERQKRPSPSFTSIEQIRDVEYDLSALEKKQAEKDRGMAEQKPIIKKKKNEMKIKEYSEEELEHELAPPAPALWPENFPISADKQRNEQKEQAGKSIISAARLKQAEENIAREKEKNSARINEQAQKKQPSIRVQRPIVINNQNKQQVNDITMPKKKSQGPIDELANLDLVNFRRLNNNPELAVKKIKEKISLLEEEGFTKRHQGINAWRHSQTYEIYINLGQESIKQGISVKDVIKRKAGSGEQVLTIEEFNAILNLNRELRA